MNEEIVTPEILSHWVQENNDQALIDNFHNCVDCFSRHPRETMECLADFIAVFDNKSMDSDWILVIIESWITLLNPDEANDLAMVIETIDNTLCTIWFNDLIRKVFNEMRTQGNLGELWIQRITEYINEDGPCQLYIKKSKDNPFK
jgi:hypothetical protein